MAATARMKRSCFTPQGCNGCHFLGVYLQPPFAVNQQQGIALNKRMVLNKRIIHWIPSLATFINFLGCYFQPPFAELRQGTMLMNQDYHERCGLREAAAREEVVRSVCVCVMLVHLVRCKKRLYSVQRACTEQFWINQGIVQNQSVFLLTSAQYRA